MNLQEISLSGGHLAGLMEAVLEKGARFRFMARGFSMSPFIRDRDIIIVYPAKIREVCVGDVTAAVNCLTHSVVVHRIVGKTRTGFILKGDNCRSPDGVFAAESVLGVVKTVERNGRQAWFGGNGGKRVVAFLSRTKILNCVVLPVFRGVKVKSFKF
jgi:hypothetical protein